MSEPFLGEIKMISWNFPPKGWAFCNGQLLPINQNQALFSILGTTYGGDGRTTFALPNLQGRVPAHVGNGIVLGQRGGESAHTLNMSELPAHPHALVADNVGADTTSANGNTPAVGVTVAQGIAARTDGTTTPVTIYAQASAANAFMNPASIVPTGGNQPHENMSPYLTINFVVALQGIFPSQN
ncbi:MAG TPA: tail fiber protein [Xanthobacteraceae bacterium]|jgi:microcystin-dependent protein